MSKCAVLLGAMCLVAEASLGGPPSKRPTKHDFGTKTPYWSKPLSPDACHEEHLEDSMPGMSCRPVQIQHLGRHGSRYTGSEDFDALEALLKEKGAGIRNDEFAFLKTWTNPFPRDQESQLTSVGKKELYEMGRRYKHKYGGVGGPLTAPHNPAHHRIQHSWKPRAARSASAFALSLFQEKGGFLGWAGLEPVAMYSIWNGVDGVDGDRELRFGKNCAQVEKNKDDDDWIGNVQVKRYQQKNMTDEIVPRIAAKLDLDEKVFELEFGDVELLYVACTFSTVVLSLPDSASPCGVFEERDFEMFAFWDDLEEYYESGPGTELNKHFACPLAHSMIQGMKTYAGGERDVDAHLRFAHSETVMGLMNLLGMFIDDVPLTADMSWEDATKRKFRGSNIAPMAVNMDMVLHECTDGAKAVHMAELKYSERQFPWPKCGTAKNVAFCSLTDLVAAYPLAETCEFDDHCDN